MLTWMIKPPEYGVDPPRLTFHTRVCSTAGAPVALLVLTQWLTVQVVPMKPGPPVNRVHLDATPDLSLRVLPC